MRSALPLPGNWKRLREEKQPRGVSRSGTSLRTGGAVWRYLLDFLSIADDGGLVPAEGGAGGEVSERERGVGMGALGM